MELQQIYLAGGCFWGVEHFLKQLHGIHDTQTGYANSRVPRPTYNQVCTGKTNAAEAVKVIYDPEEIALSFLLEQFYTIINPTSLNQQGADTGTQYRTGIYYANPADAIVVYHSLQKLQQSYQQLIVVEQQQLSNFYPSEEYHQDYLENNPTGYCHVHPNLFRQAQTAVCPPSYIDSDAELRYTYDPLPPYKLPRQASSTALRKQLSPVAYEVTQQNGTEPPFVNPYWNNTNPGIYVDVITGEPLFSSADKFDCPCGWPAFSRPLALHLLEFKPDASANTLRTEVRSHHSKAHLGHVFPDGPEETGGMRYCINSAALRFIPLEEMTGEGYGVWTLFVE